jgi:glutamate/aspartate transport system substrate-binding protein
MSVVRWSVQFALGLLLLSCGSFAAAQAVNRMTLDKIRDYRAVYVGVRENNVPFSYINGYEAVGYSIDICEHIVAAIRRELNDPALRVIHVPVTSSSRMLMLLAGTIDIECGSTTNTRIRQQLVAFGLTTFVSGIRAVVRKDSGISRIEDLDGKAVATTAGTTTERILRSVLGARKLSFVSRPARTHTESLALVAARQADAFVIDDALLAGLIANSPDREVFLMLNENFGFEPYGIALRRNDPRFKSLVDAALRELMVSGELERIYNKWFLSPIPPKGINLNIPMSGLLRDLLRNPNDEGI